MMGNDFDTVIVGGGTAGCVLAARLSEDPARRVLLLEAGGEPPLAASIPSDWPTMFNTYVDWGYHTEPQPGARGRRIFWPRGRMLGGCGSINAMIYMRGLPSDYDAWEALGCPGWGWKDILPLFLASEDNATHSNSPYHSQGGPLYVGETPYRDPAETLWMQAAVAAGHTFNPDFNGEKQEGVGWFQLHVRDGKRFGPASSYLAPALQRPNLSVRRDVTVTRIVFEGKRAVGVDLLHNAQTERVHAQAEVILTAGAVASPHLLMLSGVGPADALRKAGVTPLHDLPGVGQDLQDHLNMQISFATREPMGLGAFSEAAFEDALQAWRDQGTGPRSSPWVAAGGHICTRPGIEPDIQLYGAASPHRDYARFLYPYSGFTFHAALQRPMSRGEIRLRSADPLAAPVIDPRYFVSDPSGMDLKTLVEAVKVNRAIAAAEPLAGVISHELSPSAECRSDEEIAWHIRGHVASLYHPSSTCRMGSDPLAVVDPGTFGVQGLDGLHVADASVMPRMISANLNATVIAIAEKAASVIRGVPIARNIARNIARKAA